jgi:hypothetical protein
VRTLVFLLLLALPGAVWAQPSSPPDPLDDYRRVDGTLNWERMASARASGGGEAEALSAADIGLTLFFKELAAVARTGDRTRMTEFFDGLTDSGFYVQYGLFFAGAGAGEVAYAKFIYGHVRPRFVSALLRTNLTLAAGLALPNLVEGSFDKTFVVSLASLGLSSAAVRAGLSGVEWMASLRSSRGRTLVTRLGSRAAFLRNLGGWVYAASEMLVVVLVADVLEERINAWRDRRAARAAVAEAAEAFLEAAADPAADLAAAEADHHDAWSAYRRYLLAPLLEEEARFTGRLRKAAVRAKRLADERTAALARLGNLPGLRDTVLTTHGSEDAYLDALQRERRERLEADLRTYGEAYARAMASHTDAVFHGERREAAYLEGIDPTAPFAARPALRSALRQASANRLQTYADEAEVLALATRLRGGEPFAHAARRVEAERAADGALADARGLSGALR